ncbi:hypothetical protein CEXT_344981 [Caerostris extrusa]|uniref:Uncharacterized protein n=1 Tax=Caerostris extrusa TaxID=172846 RepID=A0AAV4PB60_CAEEX|nr:hypothetical protein CEXT_344981 [Caerostris extrusa]
MHMYKCKKFRNFKCLTEGTGFENPDYSFGNNPQEIPAIISHSVEGADFNSSAFMNRTSTFPPSTDQERHWDVNSTAGTNVRYASSNAIQMENFDYLHSSQGLTFPAAQTFENSDCTSGVKTLPMPFFNTAYTNAINPVEQPCPNNIELMQHDPN